LFVVISFFNKQDKKIFKSEFAHISAVIVIINKHVVTPHPSDYVRTHISFFDVIIICFFFFREYDLEERQEKDWHRTLAYTVVSDGVM